ncbi:hypothetical protein JXR93_08740 [bacterium]|nr:hypothetical protein [bacterium]
MKKFILFLCLIPTLIFSSGSDINMGSDYYLKILAEYIGSEKAEFEQKFQSFFDDTSSQLGFGMSYHSATPAQTLKFGILPTIDLGLDLSILQIDTSDEMWDYIIDDGDVPSVFVLPRFHVNMAFFGDTEFGFSFSMVPNSNIYLVGGEFKWSIIGTYDSFFNLAIRLAGTKLIGVEQLDLASFEANISTSFDLKILIPYFGAGIVQILADAEVPSVTSEMIDGIDGLSESQKAELKSMFPENEPFVKLKKYDHMVPKFYAGAKFDLLFINFTAEIAFSYDFDQEEYINTMYTLRANLSF